MKSSGKQIISCSLFESIRENIGYMEELAKKIDEGASIDDVVAEFHTRRALYRGRGSADN
jgi:hypothetical protein